MKDKFSAPSETPSGQAWIRFSFRWGPALVCAAAIFLVSHQSLTEEQVPVPDYLGHLAAYFALGAALVWGYSAMLARLLTLKQASGVWLWSSLYGVLDELHQSFIPLRHPSLEDVMVDSLAALLAAGSGWLLLRLLRRK